MKEVFGSMALNNSQKMYTFEDIDALPDEVWAELIDGQLYDMGHPATVHQILVRKLLVLIDQYIERSNGKCQVFSSGFGVYLVEQTPQTFVLPDICVVCDSEKIDRKGLRGAPDWVIEIVSSGSKHMDYMLKLFKYRDAGVQEYWIVDPARNKIQVYRFKKEMLDEYTFSDIVPSGIYEDLRIDFSLFKPLIDPYLKEA